MVDYPKTLREAYRYRYGQWAGNERGRQFIEGRCAFAVHHMGDWIECQCAKKAKYGAGGLYCKVHARILGMLE
jgi:hypothetical protein